MSKGKKPFQLEICSVTGQICMELECSKCKTSENLKIHPEMNYISKEVLDSAIFDTTVCMAGTTVFANRGKTVARLNIDKYNDMLARNPGYSELSKTKILSAYDTKHTHPKFLELKNTLSLEEPDEIYAEYDKVGVFICGGVVYLVAPSILYTPPEKITDCTDKLEPEVES